MKIILISERDDMKRVLERHLEPLGAEIVQYWDPIKAMDNIDEIEPDAIFFNTQDFPRHWKSLIAFVRGSYPMTRVVFIVFTGPNFSHDDAAKAEYLGVNAILSDDIADSQQIARLTAILSRYKTVHDSRAEKRQKPEIEDRVEFIFHHPVSLALVKGRVRNISASGLAFVPDTPSLLSGIHARQSIDGSLRVGQTVITVHADIVDVADTVRLSFAPDPALLQTVKTYIAEKPSRDLRRASRASA